MSNYSVQTFKDGQWKDAGDYPNTESTATTHARERARYDGLPARVINRDTDDLIAEFEVTGGSRYDRKVRRVKRS